MRLLIPLLPLTAIAAAVAVGSMIDRLTRPSLRRAGRAAAIAVALGGVAWTGAVELGSGLSSVALYRRAGEELPALAVPPVFRFINEELPADARLLFLNTNHGFHCRREFLADSFFEASQIADWLGPATLPTQVNELLARRGITHLLVHGRDWGIPYPVALLQLLRDPGLVQPLFQSPDREYTILELIGRRD